MCLSLSSVVFFFFNDPASTEIYSSCHSLSLHDALPFWSRRYRTGSLMRAGRKPGLRYRHRPNAQIVESYLGHPLRRSEEHTSELQSLMRNSYDGVCLKKKKEITMLKKMGRARV